MRMAAPVGHERTQAGPPETFLHMSHLTAFLPVASFFAFLSYGASPGPGPRPNKSHWIRPGFFGGFAAMWITPYGQLRSQLPQPMQLSAMNTSPFGARWIASGGQSFMQCGCSQWRHEVGTCTLANVGPASRSRREVPPCVSAQAFSQLSHRTHSDSSINRISVASPAPWANRNWMMSPPPGMACMARLAAARWRYSDCK